MGLWHVVVLSTMESSPTEPQSGSGSCTNEASTEDGADLHQFPSISVESTEPFHVDHLATLAGPILRVVIPVLFTLAFVLSLVACTCHRRESLCYDGFLNRLNSQQAKQHLFNKQKETDPLTQAKKALLTALAALLYIAITTFLVFLFLYFHLTVCFTTYIAIVIPPVLTILTLLALATTAGRFNLPVDWITAAVLSWNIVAVAISIFTFLPSPKLLRQLYLIFISGLISHYMIILLSAPTIWCLLGILILWDLFAVLAPCGPLKLIVQLMRKEHPRQAGGEMSNGRTPQEEEEEPPYRPQIPQMMIYATMLTFDLSTSSEPFSYDEQLGTSPISPLMEPSNLHRQGRFRPQLGLGDFIFFSVLLGKAYTSLATSLTLLLLAFSIIVGLIVTLWLLFVYRRTVPALPISLTLGLVVLTVSYHFMEPFVNALNNNLLFI